MERGYYIVFFFLFEFISLKAIWINMCAVDLIIQNAIRMTYFYSTRWQIGLFKKFFNGHTAHLFYYTSILIINVVI